MLSKFEVNAVHTSLDPSLKRYVNKKIGGLDKYLSRNIRASAHCEVHLKELNDRNNKYACEITLHLPGQTIVIKESAINMFAAIDIAEAKLKLQLKKYKDTHTSGKTNRRLMGRFRR